MEKVNFGYSLKNIPTPSEKSYKLHLIEKIEELIKRMRWKAIFYLNKDQLNSNNSSNERYGLRSSKCPSQVKELIPFENDLIALVKDIRFRKTNSMFQRKLSEDMKSVRLSNKTLTPADKTCNMYRVSKEEY